MTRGTSPPYRVLIVDLNNFARYPTIAVGYLTALLRRAGHDVRVFSPLSTGLTGVVREPKSKPWSIIDQQLRYMSAVSRSNTVTRMRKVLADRHAPKLARHAREVADDFARLLRDEDFDAVLISTYLMYRPICARIAALCQQADVPCVIGGAYFSQPEVIDEWIDINGLTGIVTGEIEPHLDELVQRMVERADVTAIAGLWRRGDDGHPTGSFAPPLQELDALPFPDYSDFPWQRYPNAIIPIITGRGCGWGACTFCSDVTSTAGRTFRSRSIDNVLDEMRYQSRRHDTNLFVFTDLKLNSNIDMWRGLLDRAQDEVPDAQWVASVHIGTHRENGLSADELRAARRAGIVRLTTGLESGSQRVLDAMKKGTRIERTAQVLHDARAADISVRNTMIIGYPGEGAEDVEASRRFLEEHRDCIERVALNRFQIMTGTRFHRRLERDMADPAGRTQFPNVTRLTINHEVAQLNHRNAMNDHADYRRAARRLISAVHRINKRDLLTSARAFEGVM